MKKSIKNIILVCTAVGASWMPRLSAQTYSLDPQQRLLQQENLWLKSANPSAIGVTALPDVGSVRFTGEHESGNLHRSMDTGVKNGWGFGADSYKSLKQLCLWGDFTFRNNRHTGRQWSDNSDPYNGNPYQAGSQLAGDYIEQSFDFSVRAASRCLFDRVWFGLGFDYALGDLSRINDPRSRVQFADMALTPGFVVQLAPHHRLGAHFSYRYRKEKNNKYITQSAAANEFLIFRQEGLGVYSKILSNLFERRVKGHFFEGGLEYEFQGDAFSLLAEVAYERHLDRIEDLIQESPGDWKTHHPELSLTARWKNGHDMHEVFMEGGATFGQADKFFQELRSEPIEGTTSMHSYYETVLEVDAFTQNKISALLGYRFLRRDKEDVLWSIRPEIAFHQLHDRYSFYVPASDRKVSNLDLSVKGACRLLSVKRHRLYAECLLGYQKNLGASLALSSELNDDLLANEVTRPDFVYFSSDVARVSLDLRYIFPLTSKINGFVKVEGTEWISTSLARQNRHFADISLGILHRF